MKFSKPEYWRGSLSLLQGIFPTQRLNPGLPHCRWILYQLNHKGNPRILGWVAYPFSRGSSWPRNRTGVSCISGRFFTNAISFVYMIMRKNMAIWHHEQRKVNLLALLFVSFENLFSFLYGKLDLLISVQIDFLSTWYCFWIFLSQKWGIQIIISVLVAFKLLKGENFEGSCDSCTTEKTG